MLLHLHPGMVSFNLLLLSVMCVISDNNIRVVQSRASVGAGGALLQQFTAGEREKVRFINDFIIKIEFLKKVRSGHCCCCC